MSDVAELMKRCQRGVGGRNALDEAHDIMAECYGTLGRLESERDALRQRRDKLAGMLLGLKVSVRDRAAARAILADDVYELIDAALSELTP